MAANARTSMEDTLEFRPSRRHVLLNLSASNSASDIPRDSQRSESTVQSSLEVFKGQQNSEEYFDENPNQELMARSRSLDLWALPPLPSTCSSSIGSRPEEAVIIPRPNISFARLYSLDNLIAYRQDKSKWAKESALKSSYSAPDIENPPQRWTSMNFDSSIENVCQDNDSLSLNSSISTESDLRRFRNVATEVGFCFTIAATQFLAEYLISGFAIELPTILSHMAHDGSASMGFWPASLLPLLLSATLLVFARLSDMYGGYFVFMFGVAWLMIWTLIPGFYYELDIVLDTSRAMQGIAIAAYTPSAFALMGTIYPEGPRRNLVMGFYAGCAPLGFFSGFLAAGALPQKGTKWYFFIATILSSLAFVTAWLTVPRDRINRRKLDLQMDWIGAFFITAGLILVAYALAAEPYINDIELAKTGFSSPTVIGPLASGLICLVAVFWYEGRHARCPLLPFDFFSPRSVKSFSFACLCFYASYGVWLYNSAQVFQSDTGTTKSVHGVAGIRLAIWYIPTAIGGIFLCIVGGSLMHRVPVMVLLLLSALSWIAAPLLLAVAPLPIHYWSYVLPSMICATLGIDLTFTISIVFFSSVQPLKYQGLSGAISSILVNLAMSFALSISEIVSKKAESVILSTTGIPQATKLPHAINWGFKATLIYAAASAALGLVICVLSVRISRSDVGQKSTVEEELQTTSSDTTLVTERGEHDVRQ